MDILRCKTPSMVRKEIYAYLLVYNLLRSLMWSAGTTYSTPPLRKAIAGHAPSFKQLYSPIVSRFF